MHRIVRSALLVAVAAGAVGELAWAEEHAPIGPVCVIAKWAPLMSDVDHIGEVPQGTVFEPTREEHDRLWSNANQGWIRRDDVLPLNEAIVWFGEELQRHPEKAELLRMRAAARLEKAILLYDNDHSSTLTAFRDVQAALKLAPQDAKALCLRAQIYAQFDNPELFLADLERAATLAPSDPWPRLLRAEYWYRHGEHAKSEQELMEVLRLDPRSVLGLQLRACLHDLSGEHVATLADIDEALLVNPHVQQPYYLRARIQLLQGNADLALSDCDAADRAYPDDPKVAHVRAGCLALLGRNEAALESLDRAIELAPNEAGYYAARATIHFSMRRVEPVRAPDSEPKSETAAMLEKFMNSEHLPGIAPLPQGRITIDVNLKAEGLTPEQEEHLENRSSTVLEKSAGGEWKVVNTRAPFRAPLEPSERDPHVAAALADYAEARRIAPRDGEILWGYDSLLWSLSRFEESFALLDDAVWANPDSPLWYGRRGTHLAMRGRMEEALRDMDRAVRLAPDDPIYRNLRMVHRYEARDLCGCEEDCRVFLQLQPLDPDAWCLLAVVLGLQGRTDEAFDLLKTETQLPPSARARLTGIFWGLEGEYQRARRLSQHAEGDEAIRSPQCDYHAQLFSQFAISWQNEPHRVMDSYTEVFPQPDADQPPAIPLLRLWGDLALRRGEFDEAIEHYSHAIDHAGCNSRLWVRRARAYIRQGRFKRAAADIDQALLANPACPFALAARAHLAVERGDLAAATNDCRAALTTDPESVEAIAVQARIARLERIPDRCLSRVAAALQLNPHSSDALREQGWAYLALHQDDRAIKAFDASLELQPDIDAHFGMAEALRRVEHHKMAIRQYDRAVAQCPQWAAATAGRGVAWLHLGNRVQAEAEFTAALDINPKEVRALAGRGELRRQMGEYDAAARDLRRALELCPDIGEAAESLTWILAACPVAELRNGKLAVELAEAAIRDRSTIERLRALAAAHAEAGDFKAAAAAEKRAREAAPAFMHAEFDERIAQFGRRETLRLVPNPPADIQPAEAETSFEEFVRQTESAKKRADSE